MSIPLGIALGVNVALIVILVIFICVRIRTISRSFVYTVKGKEVVVRYTFKNGAQIFVNGSLEEQYLNSHASRFTIRATIDGEEFKAHVSIGFSVKIEGYYQGALLTPDSVGK